MTCHCECNEVERRNRKDSAITSLRYRYVPFSSLRDAKSACFHEVVRVPPLAVRNDKHLAGLDIICKFLNPIFN
ncbi:MAG: hypothetical protein FWK04_20145 [Nostoc sp. GBBB01]|nr:hypothetical protein [Nostoc sp. GBBB01]MDZ8015253.1 hypothetical protein [Nostoc sp. ZfuVER08]